METANTFATLYPLLKESYASGPMKTHKCPGKEEKFKTLKDKIKKGTRGK